MTTRPPGYEESDYGPDGIAPWQAETWPEFRDTSPEEHRWIVDGLLPEAALAFIAGPPKKGKTWIGLALAIAVAAGTPLLEFAIQTPRPVLYVALEGSRPGLRARIGALTRGFELDPDTDELDRLHVLYRPRPFNLVELEHAVWLHDEATRLDAGLIVIDVLRAAARYEENDAGAFAHVRASLEPLFAAGRTALLLHHFGKLTDTQKERSPGERMAGTGAMYGALDVGFLITRSDQGARAMKLEIEARDFAAPDAVGIAITGSGSGEHGGFTYSDSAKLELDARAITGKDYVAEAELALDGLGAGLGRDELAERLGCGHMVFEAAFDADAATRRLLGEDPRIVRWERKRDGRFPYRKAPNAAPYLTADAYASARLAAGPSQPSMLEEGSAGCSVPSKEGSEQPSIHPDPGRGPAEWTEPDPEEGSR